MLTLRQAVKASVTDLHGMLPVQRDGYAWQDNGSKILGVAHCDCVDKGSDHYARRGPLVWSSRLDDRLGVWVMLNALPKLGLKFDVLLTTDEEIGRSTAQFFHEKDYNWVFQFDRRGTDAVTYDSWHMDYAVKRHFRLGNGSFSDICYLDQPGFNVGTGYYNEHTLGSYADLRETYQQMQRFVGFYDEFSGKYFDRPQPYPTAKAPAKAPAKTKAKYVDWGKLDAWTEYTESLDDLAERAGYQSVQQFAADNGCSYETAERWLTSELGKR